MPATKTVIAASWVKGICCAMLTLAARRWKGYASASSKTAITRYAPP
jgi:hypothetical protein